MTGGLKTCSRCRTKSSPERERAALTRPESLDAWELFHRGLWHVYRFTRQDFELAEAHFRAAASIAPDFALPLAGLAYAQFVKVTWNFVDDVGVAIAEGMRLAEHAVALDDAEPFAHSRLAGSASMPATTPARCAI